MSQGRRERILDEAAQWMALLQSGHAGAEERLAFQQWRQADAEHGAVFDRLSLGLLRESEINQKGKARKLWDIEEGKGI